MPERKRTVERTKRSRSESHSVREARPEYDAAEDAPEEACTRLSSKNQITIPAALTRELGWRPGDEIDILLVGDRLRLRKRLYGKELLDRLEGSWAGAKEWRTREDVDRWVQSLKDEWERDWRKPRRQTS